MNKQGEGKIEWTDYTWNPVTGCLHGCHYCYAERVATRFSTCEANGDDVPESVNEILTPNSGTVVELNQRLPGEPWPYGFTPTFHRYRLNEPKHLKKPSRIFVSSMGDLFGRWVPPVWIDSVLSAMVEARQHTYQLLTRNPERYRMHSYRRCQWGAYKAWIGATATEQGMAAEMSRSLGKVKATVKFLSIEPFLGEVSGFIDYNAIDWIIVGQQTGPRAEPVKDVWVQRLIDCAYANGVPVFVKKPLFERFPIQQWPDRIVEPVTSE